MTRRAKDQHSISELFAAACKKKRTEPEEESTSPVVSGDSCTIVSSAGEDTTSAAVSSISCSTAGDSGNDSSTCSGNPAPSLTDIGTYFDDDGFLSTDVDPRLLDENSRLVLLQNHFRPGIRKEFVFSPILEKTGREHESKRFFQRSWLEQYSWLTFSPSRNGGFCLPCTLFSKPSMSGILYRKPMTNFTKASDSLKKHEQQNEHKSCCVRATGFLAVTNAEIPSVPQQLIDVAQRQRTDNVEKVTSLLRTIEFCGRQNISLLGHRKDGFSMDPGVGLDQNPGIFWLCSVFELMQVIEIYSETSISPTLLGGKLSFSCHSERTN